jgi:hypothetical protein
VSTVDKTTNIDRIKRVLNYKMQDMYGFNLRTQSYKSCSTGPSPPNEYYTLMPIDKINAIKRTDKNSEEGKNVGQLVENLGKISK